MEMDKYLEIVCAQIRSGRARDMAAQELRDHIEDQALAYEAEGLTREEAVKEAVRQMGDPVRAGVELDRIHRPKMEWRLFGWIVAFSILGLCLQYFCFYRIGEAAGGSMRDFGVQCVCTLAGLGIMAAVCLYDYSILGKHPNVWGACFLGALWLSCKSGIFPMVNGGYPYLKCLMYFFVPVYGGILYGNRGKGFPGLAASALWTGAAFLLGAGAIGGGFSVTADAAAVCILMFLVAAGGEWFGISRRKGLAFAAAALGAACLLLVINLQPYQLTRLRVLLRPEDFAQTAGYQLSGIRRIVSSLSLGQSSYGVLEQRGLLDFWNNMGIKSNYMILQSAVVLGLAKTGALCILYGLFFGYLFLLAVREKNSLGRMTALGCNMVLALETVRNILYNFGFGLSSTAGIPFFSFGKLHTLAVYGLLGIILSVYRYRNLVWDAGAGKAGERDKEGLRIGNYVIRVEKTDSSQVCG